MVGWLRLCGPRVEGPDSIPGQGTRSHMVPGSSPSGSRVIRRGDGIGVLGKNFFNYKYRERLGMDSIVGNISGEKEAE